MLKGLGVASKAFLIPSPTGKGTVTYWGGWGAGAEQRLRDVTPFTLKVTSFFRESIPVAQAALGQAQLRRRKLAHSGIAGRREGRSRGRGEYAYVFEGRERKWVAESMLRSQRKLTSVPSKSCYETLNTFPKFFPA